MAQTDPHQRYQELARKRLEGTITPEEAAELAAWLNQDDGQPLEVPASFAGSHSQHGKRMLQAIEKEITPVIRVHRRILRTASAAAILLLIITGGYFFFRQPAPLATDDGQGLVNDRRPGGNKATLTLAGGQQIVLEHIDNGSLFNQGGTRVIKLDSGSLAYNVDVQTENIQFNTLTTPRGGQFQIRLPDGSKVWLNAASSLKYPTSFSGKERVVELQGQGYFEIAQNPDQPFKVRVNDMEVQVLGTHFDIMAYNDEQAIRTTLLEGAVSVSQNHSSRVLHPGEQAVVAAGNEVQVLDHVNVQEAIAWKNGVFQFNRAGLPVVMRQLSRWYDVEVVYEGKIPEQEFLGKMQRELNLSEVLSILEKSGVRFRMEGRKIIVSQ